MSDNTGLLRLYLESHIRAHTPTDLSSLTDEELAGLAMMLPDPKVSYDAWSEKITPKKFEDMSREDVAEMNKQASEQLAQMKAKG